MRSRVIGWTIAACGCAICATQADLTVFAEDGLGDFRLLAPSHDAAVFQGISNKKQFDVKGSPVVQKNSSGFQLSGQELAGTYSAQRDGAFQIDTLHATGGSVMIFDSKRADDFAGAAHVSSSLIVQLTKLRSKTIDMTQENQVATVTLKNSFTLDDHRETKPPQLPSKRSSDFSGTSGTFKFSLPKKATAGQTDLNAKKPATAKLLSGEANGPVHFHSVEDTVEVHLAIFYNNPARLFLPVERTFDAVGDHLSVDMSKAENQVVLSGHVSFRYSMDGFQGTSDQVLATVDEDGKITNVIAERFPVSHLPKSPSGVSP